MVAARVATFWLALIAPAMVAAARPDAGPPGERAVAADGLEVLAEPADTAYPTGTLRRGARVVVLAEDGDWARIRPPADAFEWVDAASLREGGDGTTTVAARTRVRLGAPGARLPGPPGRFLDRGAVVRLLDRPELHTGDLDHPRIWLAIRPDPAASRYVPLAGLEPDDPDPLPPALAPPGRPERLASFEPEAGEPDLPAAVNAELASIAVAYRSTRAGDPEGWDLGPIRDRYAALLRQFGTDPAVKAAVGRRLARADADAAVAAKARAVGELLRQGDQRDGTVARVGRSAALARARSDRQYDAQGLLQPSSKRYRGQQVLALIGPEGRPIGYLTVPPGLPVDRYLARRVGVRGVVHFDEGLGARLISVRDLDLIEKAR